MALSRRNFLYLSAGALLRGQTAATVTVSSAVTGVIGPGFAGLSYEKSQMANPFFSPQNTDAIGLFKLIGPSLLRIGGNSVDKTTWTPNGKGRTSGQVAPSDIDALAGFLRATGWQVLYGTNLAQSTPALAAAEIAYAVQSLGSSLYGIEIGNEVDLYHSNGYFPSTWGFSDYLTLWQSFATAIRQLSPNVPLTGPVAASNISGYVAPFAKAEGRNVILLSDHYYRGNGQSASSTVDLLVSPDANIVTQAKEMLAVSQSIDVPYRFAETNSFYNGGAPNVSDSYASALWVIDHLFACASNGAQGINLHGGGNSTGYTPIADSDGVVVEARPEFYGVLLFTLAGQGTLQQTTINAGGINATAYAIKAVNGALSIIINNKDQAQTLNVTLQVPQPVPGAMVIQMTGPALDSTVGMAIQGASIQADGTFSPGSSTVLSSLLSLGVAPLTAALVQIPPPTTAPLTIAGPAAPASLTSAYGSGLGSTVSVQDSAGVPHSATILYSSPSQVNFEIPDSASIGAAVVTIGSQTAMVLIQAIAPSLYILNSSGLAAAYVVQVSASGVQTDLPVTMPINLSSGQVYLVLYGTGIRGAGNNVSVTIGGLNAPVAYAGPAGSTPGLDQVNVLIPPQLAGAGTVKVILSAALIDANVVNITVQ
ncbi:MAG TPA: hypothetical protein VK752_21045 [Bryobacteraceae bacterium]|nr:hypothetical protein [Bryobacteraceae bacterium]